jgi:hypothetical protein
MFTTPSDPKGKKEERRKTKPETSTGKGKERTHVERKYLMS